MRRGFAFKTKLKGYLMFNFTQKSKVCAFQGYDYLVFASGIHSLHVIYKDFDKRYNFLIISEKKDWKLSWTQDQTSVKNTKKEWILESNDFIAFGCLGHFCTSSFILRVSKSYVQRLRSCLDLWWEKHSFEYCLKLRRWVHIIVLSNKEF